MISEEEKARYFDRALRYDPERVDRLLSSSVLVVGCGAIGSTLATWLARAGVGSMVLVDGDVLEEHNLERYEGLTLDDVGKPKAYALAEYLLRVRPWMSILAYPLHLDDLLRRCLGDDRDDEACQRLWAAASDADLMVVGVDNNWARYWATWLAMQYDIPYLEVGFNAQGYAGIWFFEDPRRGPCRLCAFTREDYGTDPLGYNFTASCPRTGRCLKVSGWGKGGKVLVFICGSTEHGEAERVYEGGKVVRVRFRCPACGELHELATPDTPAPAAIEVVRRACAEALEVAIDFLVRGDVPEWNLKLVKGDWREFVKIDVHESHPHECFWRRCEDGA